ncbi:MAG: hypothetical protein GQ533_06150 [Methanosarcinaceae archaeon]|nr:hypothetical protein [Methanosarcinaceae archaeon]
MLYALRPYSLNKALLKRKFGCNEVSATLRDGRLIIYPPTLDLKKIVTSELDKTIAFIPYCAKPFEDFECPANDPDYGRKNQKCIKVSGGECNVPCSVGKMVDVLLDHGYKKDQIFIIDSDSNLFPWLIKKKEEGYKYVIPGVACYYGIGYALDFIGDKLGYRGCIVLLEDYIPGDTKHGVCRSISDYMYMEKIDKGKRTKIDDKSVRLIEKILDGEYP